MVNEITNTITEITGIEITGLNSRESSPSFASRSITAICTKYAQNEYCNGDMIETCPR